MEMKPHNTQGYLFVHHLLCSAEINLQLGRALAVLPTFQQLPCPQALYPGHPFVTKGIGIWYQAVRTQVFWKPCFLGARE